jgi:hypothetical protein
MSLYSLHSIRAIGFKYLLNWPVFIFFYLFYTSLIPKITFTDTFYFPKNKSVLFEQYVGVHNFLRKKIKFSASWFEISY